MWMKGKDNKSENLWKKIRQENINYFNILIKLLFIRVIFLLGMFVLIESFIEIYKKAFNLFKMQKYKLKK